MSTSDTGHTLLSPTAEHMMAIDIFFNTPIFLTLLILILLNLRQKYSSSSSVSESDQHSLSDVYFTKGLQFAITSCICSILVCLLKAFFCNDLLIGWHYDGNAWSTMSDSLLMAAYSVGKLAFYFSVTYHVHSKDRSSPISMSVYIWMSVVGICTVLLAIVFLIDDATTTSSQEIGVTALHSIHLAMFMSHDGAEYAQWAAILMVIVDAIYFIVLFYLYINRLQKVADNNNGRSIYNNIRCVIITIWACLEFWLFAVTVAMNWELKWALAGLDDFVPNLCLFLMYEGGVNDVVYLRVCGRCNNKIGRVIYGNKYVDIVEIEDAEQEMLQNGNYDRHYDSEQNTLI